MALTAAIFSDYQTLLTLMKTLFIIDAVIIVYVTYRICKTFFRQQERIKT